MAVWCEDIKILYSLCPRTGSTATACTLIEACGGLWLPSEDILDESCNYLVQRKHSTFNEILQHGLIDLDKFYSAHRLVTVRNPFDSVFSLWYKKKTTYTKLVDDKSSFIHRIPGFSDDIEFIQSNDFSTWFLLKYSKAADEGRQVGVNKKWVHNSTSILKFETLQKEFEEFLSNVLRYPEKVTIPVINKTENKPSDYRNYYSSDAIDVGLNVFKWELDKFGYTFE